MREELAKRESMLAQDFYAKFYADSGIDSVLIDELVRHIAAELSVDAAKILPSDRFAVELAPARGNAWDSGFGILAIELKRLAKEKGRHLDQPIETVDDYLRAMADVY
jgi:hypothetical protein